MPLIGIGSAPNDHTGDVPRTVGQKINRLPNPSSTINADSGDYTGTNTQKVTAAVADAVAQGKSYVWIPKSMLGYGAATLSTSVWMIREGQNPGVFDALAYGATATLAVDQTAYIQAAIDAQHAWQAGKVWIPGGSYAITGLKYYSGTIMEGEGFVGTVGPGTQLLQSSAAAIMLQPNSTAARTTGFAIRNLLLSSSGNVNNLGGIDLTNCIYYVVEDVTIASPAVFGVRVVGGNVVGDAGFGHFSRVTIVNHQSGAYAWLISSSATDQPDGLTFTDCKSSSTLGTWIKYACVASRPGAGSNVWSGCTFEAQGGNATTDITVDAAGAGMNTFLGCRFENTGSGGIQVTLNGFGIQPFGAFLGCVWAGGSGGFTWTDNGPVLSRRFADINGNTNGLLFQTLGLQTALRTVTSGSTTLTQNDHTVIADATGGAITLTLPTPSAAVGNQTLRIKKKDSSSNTVTVSPAGLQIDGAGSSLVLVSQNAGVELQTDGSNWFVVAGNSFAYSEQQIPAFSQLNWGPRSSGNYLQIDGTPRFVWSLSNTTQLTMTTAVLGPTSSGGKHLGTAALPFGNAYLSLALVSGQVALGTGSNFTPNAANGNSFTATLNAATTINAPTNPSTGQRIHFTLIQDGTGGRNVTWNVVFKVTWSDTGNTLNKRSTIAFVYDGTNWNQDGAQTPYV